MLLNCASTDSIANLNLFKSIPLVNLKISGTYGKNKC